MQCYLSAFGCHKLLSNFHGLIGFCLCECSLFFYRFYFILIVKCIYCRHTSSSSQLLNDRTMKPHITSLFLFASLYTRLGKSPLNAHKKMKPENKRVFRSSFQYISLFISDISLCGLCS